MRLKSSVIAMGFVALLATCSQAHVWRIGWSADATDGSLSLYGVSYHNFVNADSADNFSANPSGVIVNGTSYTYDLGSAVDLDANSANWTALGLDGQVDYSSYSISGSSYQKYAVKKFSSTDLASMGLTPGTHNVTLGAFSNNQDWEAWPSSIPTATITVLAANGAVPEPASLAVFAGLFGAVATFRRRKP